MEPRVFGIAKTVADCFKFRNKIGLELDDAWLTKPSWVKISQIRTLSAQRIGRKLGVVEPEQVARVIEGLNEILGA